MSQRKSFDIPVSGLTHLDGLLYVLLDDRPASVRVYDLASNTKLTSFRLPLNSYADVASSEYKHRLYFGHSSGEIYEVKINKWQINWRNPEDIDLIDETYEWSAAETILALSVTPKCNILVTCHPNKLLQFDPSGELMLTVRLDANPWHAVRLTTGQFAVCFSDRVSIVDSSGCIMKSYGGTRGAGPYQQNNARHLAADGDGYIFVADSNNDRVVLLSPTLSYVRSVVSYSKDSNPRRLSLDIAKTRLYVTDCEQRVIDYRI